MTFIKRLVISLCFLITLQAGSAAAQMQALTGGSSAPETTETVMPDVLTPEAINQMVARMSDDEVRGMLLDRLDAVAKSNAEPQIQEGFGTRLVNTFTGIAASLTDVIYKVPNLLSNQIKAFSNFSAKFPGNNMALLFGYIALVLAVGYAAERGVGLLTRRWKIPADGIDDADLKSTVIYLFRRFLREMLGLIAFYVVLLFFGRRLLDPVQLAFAGPFVTYLIWTPRLTAAVSRFILSPKRPDLRLVNLDDRWAQYLHRHLIGLFLMIGFTLFIVRFNVNSGVPMGNARLGFWLNTAVHIYIGMIAWNAREGLTNMMRGTDPDNTKYDEMVARGYPYYAVGISAMMWLAVEAILASKNRDLIQLLGQGIHYTTMFWLLIAPALDSLIRGLVRHLQPPMIGEGDIAEIAYKATKRSFIRIGRVIVAGIIILLIASAWQIDLFSISNQGPDAAGADIFQFLFTLAIGYIVYESVSLWINRRLAKEQTSSEVSEDQAAGDGGGAGGSRLTTVLPLVRITAQVGIWIIFVLLAIGNLGIDITPLLAGAGILGLAIGFGAQKLVSDIVSGVFFLIDDAFRVGEYVEVDGTMGTVEKISIRSMQLRHHRGLVHTIPYGEIPKLTNFSRDWVIMKLMFTVPFDTDPNKVKKIFKKIGAEMLADPLFHDDFLEPFKSQGVLQFDDVGIVMRGKFMAKPGTQFTIRKEIYNRVRNEFAANGIEFARREVRVALPGMENSNKLSAEEKTMVGAAAAGSVIQAELDKLPKA